MAVANFLSKAEHSPQGGNTCIESTERCRRIPPNNFGAPQFSAARVMVLLGVFRVGFEAADLRVGG